MINYSPELHPLKDESVLLSLQNEVGEDLLKSLLQVFCDESEQLFQQLLAAIESDNGDKNEITRLLHSVKSGAKTYGANRLAALSGELEDQARQGNIIVVSDNAKQLEALLASTIKLFKP